MPQAVQFVKFTDLASIDVLTARIYLVFSIYYKEHFMMKTSWKLAENDIKFYLAFIAWDTSLLPLLHDVTCGEAKMWNLRCLSCLPAKAKTSKSAECRGGSAGFHWSDLVHETMDLQAKSNMGGFFLVIYCFWKRCYFGNTAMIWSEQKEFIIKINGSIEMFRSVIPRQRPTIRFSFNMVFFISPEFLMVGGK